MPNERRTETPTSDRVVQREMSVTVILQGLILAAIIGSVSVLLDIKETLSTLSVQQQVTTDRVTDHETRLRILEGKP